MSPHVTVVVLAYNAAGHIEAGVLDRVVESARRSASRAAVVLVDNASSDDTVPLMLARHPDVHVLRCLHNTLYCTGMNVGLQYAHHRFTSDYYVLVDHDYLVEKGYLDELVAFMETHPEAGTCQCLTHRLDSPAEVYSAGHRYDERGACWPITELPDVDADFVETRSSSIAASIFRGEALARTGLLDPVLRMYYESSDISFRLRAAGYRTYCHLRARASQEGHVHQGYRHHTWFYVWRNRPIFWAKHDAGMYDVVRRHYQQELERIACDQEALDFLRPEHEADETRRRAIVEGLWIGAATAQAVAAGEARPEVPLDGFEKGSAVLVAP